MFHQEGAGLTYTPPPNGVGDATDWVFSATNDVINVGTTATDLIMFLPDVKSSICSQINRVLDSTFAADETDLDFTEFTGSFTATETIDQANGQEAGCVNYDDGADTNPLFYYVLIKR